MLAATWLMKVGTTDAARMPWTRIAPISWLTRSSAASSLVSVVASMPAKPSKNAPVKTREKECGSELSDVAGAVVGRVSGDGMIIAIIEKELEGVSRGGTYIRDDVERIIWIYNPLRLPLPSTFMFKQYETAHPYSTWDAELSGGECQEVFFGTALEERLPERIRDLAKIVRLEKSDEFKRCLKE